MHSEWYAYQFLSSHTLNLLLIIDGAGVYCCPYSQITLLTSQEKEVLTGKTPFHGLKHSQILCLVSRGEKVPPRPDIGIRDDLWIVLKLCWNRDPTKRPRIEIIRDGLRALFRPPFDTWSIHETTSQSQGSRKRVVGEDEGDERQRELGSFGWDKLFMARHL